MREWILELQEKPLQNDMALHHVVHFEMKGGSTQQIST